MFRDPFSIVPFDLHIGQEFLIRPEMIFAAWLSLFVIVAGYLSLIYLYVRDERSMSKMRLGWWQVLANAIHDHESEMLFAPISLLGVVFVFVEISKEAMQNDPLWYDVWIIIGLIFGFGLDFVLVSFDDHCNKKVARFK